MYGSTFKLKIFIILALYVFLSFPSYSAQCKTFYYTTNNKNGVNYDVYHAENKSIDTCIDTVLITGLEYKRLKTLDEQFSGEFAVTPEDIAISFSWGFGTYLSFWWLAYIIRTAKKAIRMM